MRKIVLIALFLIAACAWAQVEPAATGPAFPQMNGNLQYSARYSQTGFLYDQTQFPGGNQVGSTVSANLAYTHPSVRRPFSTEYGGGYMWPISGPSLGTGVFQHLLLSQSFVQRRWTLVASDGVSYTPQSPIIGFSGVPGTGEPVGGSGTTPAAGQSILTVNTRVLDNHADLRLQYSLGHATTFAITGGSELLRYPDSNGLDSDSEDVSPDLQQLKAQLRVAQRSIVDEKQQQNQQQIRTYEGRIESTPLVDQQYKQLTRDHDAALQFYNSLLSRMNELPTLATISRVQDLRRQQKSMRRHTPLAHLADPLQGAID